ncbi:TetR/AcrR family transcriptional regulator [Cohnella abietis]|nr:TetR/AcrR family transcriptional regulator [Cohnella abietis]
MLIDALIELVIEKGYEPVTVRDIVVRAHINRSTFYLHFQDKKDILDEMTNEVLTDLKQSMANPPAFNLTDAMKDFRVLNKPIESAVKLFSHVQNYSALYAKMLPEVHFRDQVLRTIKNQLPSTPTEEIVIDFVTNGIVGIMLYWLNNGMKESVEEISLEQTKLALAIESFK